MIHEDCTGCEFLDEDNENLPCKLDHYLGCNILKSYIRKEKFWRLIKHD